MDKMTPETEALKARLKATWMAGDFGQIAKTYADGAEDFIKRLELKPDTRVLDVACGTGNLAIPAARAGAKVTGADIAVNLLEQGRERARSEGVNVQFDEGDAENLPYEDAAFDVVVTMFGAMFAPRPEIVAAELTRVCRPGGTIAMANWTPAGFVGQMFKITASHLAPPPGMPSPVLWGDEAVVRERLSRNISDLRLTRRLMTFRFPVGPADVVEAFRLYYGPTQRAFEALDPNSQIALRRDLEKLWTDHNKETDGTTRVESEYLEVVAIRS